MELKKGSRVRVLTAESDREKTDETTIWVDYPNLPRVLEKGSKIYIDDGLIGLKVLETGKLVCPGDSEAVTAAGRSLAVVCVKSLTLPRFCWDDPSLPPPQAPTGWTRRWNSAGRCAAARASTCRAAT